MTNSRDPSRPNLEGRLRLKKRLFERDGWVDDDGVWWALCAFECGRLLVMESATLDRYPIPGRNGGRYVLGNTRLACGPCNWNDGTEWQRQRAKERNKKAKRKTKGQIKAERKARKIQKQLDRSVLEQHLTHPLIESDVCADKDWYPDGIRPASRD